MIRFFLFVLMGVVLVGGISPAFAQESAPVPAPVQNQSEPPPPSPSTPVIDPTTFSNLIRSNDAPEKMILDMAREQMKKELEKLNQPEAKVPSLLFTTREQEALDVALANMSGSSRVPTMDPNATGEEPERYTPSKPKNKKYVPRDIILSGITYHDDNDWVIWLNKMRVTPKEMPREIKFIHVTKDFVEIKWYDEQENKVVALRLKPGQHYHLDYGFVAGSS